MSVTIKATHGSFVSCTCMSRWWPMFEAMCKKRGLPIPRVTQGSYRPATSYSAATHVGGGVVDFVTDGDWDETDTLAETMGGADFVRPAIVNLWRKHCHLILTGCPHLHKSAQGQVEDWMNLRSGLASNLPDTDRTRPPTWRTFGEGVEWARRQLAPTAAPTAPTTPVPKEDDMPLSPDDIAKVAAATTDKLLGQLLGSSGPTVGVALQATYRNARDAAAAQGVDVDEAAIATGLAASVGPLVRDAVVAAVQAGGTPDAIADAVLGKLGAALAPVPA